MLNNLIRVIWYLYYNKIKNKLGKIGFPPLLGNIFVRMWVKNNSYKL